MMIRYTPELILLIVGMALGAFAYHHIADVGTVAVIEQPAPEVKQADGSTILAKKPGATPASKAPIKPKGSKNQGTVEVVIRPDPPVTPPNTDGLTPQVAVCPDIKLRLDYEVMHDGSTVVIAKAEDGTLLEGVHIPAAAAVTSRELPWAAGIAVRPTEKGLAAFVDRDLRRLRVGGSLGYGQESGVTSELRIGWRFP